MDLPALAPDNMKEGSLVFLLISVGVSFAWRKEELESQEICPWSSAPVYCLLHRTRDNCVWILHDDHKACMVTANNSVVKYGVKSVKIIYKWKNVFKFCFPSQRSNRMFQVSSRSLTEGEWAPYGGVWVWPVKWGLCLPSWLEQRAGAFPVSGNGTSACWGATGAAWQRRENSNGFHVICIRRFSCLMQRIEWLVSIGANWISTLL